METSKYPPKVGLFITTLLHDITQAGYRVAFNSDFEGMIRIDYTKEHVSEFYEHDHVGVSGGTREQLEKSIIDSLVWFRNEYNIPEATKHGNTTY